MRKSFNKSIQGYQDACYALSKLGKTVSNKEPIHNVAANLEKRCNMTTPLKEYNKIVAGFANQLTRQP